MEMVEGGEGFEVQLTVTDTDYTQVCTAATATVAATSTMATLTSYHNTTASNCPPTNQPHRRTSPNTTTHTSNSKQLPTKQPTRKSQTQGPTKDSLARN